MRTTQELNEYSMPNTFFNEKIVEEGMLHTEHQNWATDGTLSALPIWKEAWSSRTNQNGNEYIAAEVYGGQAMAYCYSGEIYLTAAAKDQATVKEILDYFREVLPEAKRDEPNEVSIRFWSLGNNGPSSVRRRIVVPEWPEIEENYGDDVRGPLGDLMSFENGDSLKDGQLVLWQGQPGTGKTYALRALARSWRDWCDFHYIVDPERFFGSSAEYMLSVILGGDHPYEADDDEQPRWKLLILEDSGELLAADAKQQVGQALSRLLNVVDGLIGQGLRLLVLVTTNEELKALHPAVSRHGRCAQKLEFKALSGEDLQKWVEKHELDTDKSKASIADLFALKQGINGDKAEAVGFGIG